MDADDLAFWADSAGEPAAAPPGPDDAWLLTHRWVWSRSRIEHSIAALGAGGRDVFICGIARNQAEMLDLFEHVFLLMIDLRGGRARWDGAAAGGGRQPPAGQG